MKVATKRTHDGTRITQHNRENKIDISSVSLILSIVLNGRLQRSNANNKAKQPKIS